MNPVSAFTIRLVKLKSPLCTFALAALCAAALTGCSKETKQEAPPAKIDLTTDTAPAIEIKTDAQKMGYSVGIDNAQNLGNQFKGMTLNMKALALGFSDELNGRPRRLPDPVIGENVTAMRKHIMDKAPLQVDADKAGYSVGIDHANNLREQYKDGTIDYAALGQGLSDEVHGRPKKITAEEIEASIKSLRSKMIDQMMKEGMAEKASKSPAAIKNLEEGRKFLEENAKKPGVKTTASGLQYTVLQEGTGEQPSATDRVTVHYQGTLISGKVFDSSYSRKEPLTFALNEVIPGWTEGLQLMKVGAKYKLFIPSDLAYGPAGPSGIGPNSTLIFDVELLKVEK